MALKNSAEKFGSLTKILHWLIFFLFVTQYFLVYRREYFPKDSPEKLQYLLLHESIGFIVLVLALLMITWRHAGTRPLMPSNMSGFEKFLAKATHFLLYATMLIQPLSGFAMSQLGGYKPAFFGYTLPILLAKNEQAGHIMYTTHVWCSYVIIGLVSLHVIGALYHHFLKKDKVFLRMLPG